MGVSKHYDELKIWFAQGECISDIHEFVLTHMCADPGWIGCNEADSEADKVVPYSDNLLVKLPTCEAL